MGKILCLIAGHEKPAWYWKSSIELPAYCLRCGVPIIQPESHTNAKLNRELALKPKTKQ